MVQSYCPPKVPQGRSDTAGLGRATSKPATVKPSPGGHAASGLRGNRTWGLVRPQRGSVRAVRSEIYRMDRCLERSRGTACGLERIAMNDMTERGAPCRTASFYLERTLDRPVVGYTHGSRWNGWATPMFDRDTAMQVMRAVNDANEGGDNQISISYEESCDHLRGTGWQGMTVI